MQTVAFVHTREIGSGHRLRATCARFAARLGHFGGLAARNRVTVVGRSSARPAGKRACFFFSFPLACRRRFRRAAVFVLFSNSRRTRLLRFFRVSRFYHSSFRSRRPTLLNCVVGTSYRDQKLLGVIGLRV